MLNADVSSNGIEKSDTETAHLIVVAQVRYDAIVADNQAFELYEGDQYMDTDEKTCVEATQSSMKLIHLWEGITGITTYVLFCNYCILILYLCKRHL